MTYLVKGVQGNLAIWSDCNKMPFMEREGIGPIFLKTSLSLVELPQCQSSGCPLLRKVNGDFFPHCGISLQVLSLDRGLRSGYPTAAAADISQNLSDFAARVAIISYRGRIPANCPREWNKVV